jgi:TolB-like protein/Tfp pilus assembly protein PilF
VVEEKLAGRGAKIKGYSIALNVLNRDESFDPQIDPIVRIEAGRLRRALERYYLVSGQTDPLRIEIPKGTYVPSFVLQHQPVERSPASAEDTSSPGGDKPPGPLPIAKAALDRPIKRISARTLIILTMGLLAAAVSLVVGAARDFGAGSDVARSELHGPSLLMLPLSTEDANRVFSDGFTAELLAELNRYTEIFVFAPETTFRSAAIANVTDLHARYGASYVLRGGVGRQGSTMRIDMQLLAGASGRIVWAETFDIREDASSIFAAQAEIAARIAKEIGEPYGAIAAADWETARGKAPATMAAYECVLQAYDYRRRFDPAGYDQVQDCLIRTVEENPQYAEAWAMLALIYIDLARFRPIDSAPPDTLTLALAAAEKSVDLAPKSAAAHRALIAIRFLRQEPEQGFAEGDTALELNPNSSEVMYELGLRHVLSGDVDRGLDLLRHASEHNPAAPELYGFSIALGEFRKGDYQGALATVQRAGAVPRQNFLYWAIVTAIYAKAGVKDEAEAAKAELLAIYPDFAEHAIAELRKRSVAPDLAAHFIEAWRLARLEIPARPGI